MKRMIASGILTHETAGQLVDELTYNCYAYNRNRSPYITPEQWKSCFGAKINLLESRYQRELKAKKDHMN